jgi:hypothetical protein
MVASHHSLGRRRELRSLRRLFFTLVVGVVMLTISGTGLVGLSGLIYWRLLPRNGREHPLVSNPGVGSTITIVLLTTMTVGIALLCEGLFS